MRALLYAAASTFAYTEVPEPSPRPDEVRVRVAFTGICGTDILIRHDKHSRSTPPVILGHEFSGIVDKVGEEVASFRIGDRVVVEPLLNCDDCPGCATGEHNLCESMRLLGIDVDGSLAPVVTVRADRVIRIPDELGLREAALVEPLAVASHLIRRVRGVDESDRVFVFGGGPIGLLAGCIARAEGSRVVVVEVNEFRRAKAAELGLEVVDGSQDVVTAARALFGAAGASVAIEATGIPAGLRTCVAVVGPRGRIGVVGLPKSAPELDVVDVIGRELEIYGSRVYTAVDFEDALRLLADGKISPDAHISRVVPFEEAIVGGFDAIEAGAPVTKILIDQGLGQ